MIRKYHNQKLQTTLWQREEEPLNHHETTGRQTKQSNQLSLPHQDDRSTGMDTNVQQNIEQLLTLKVWETERRHKTIYLFELFM